MLIQVLTAVHLTYPYRTSLAPQPPFCWQSPGHALTSMARRVSGGTLSVGLRTTPLPGSHANLGYCQSHGRSRHSIPQGSRQDKVGQSFRSWFTSDKRSKPPDEGIPLSRSAGARGEHPTKRPRRRAHPKAARPKASVFSLEWAPSKLAVHQPDSWALRPRKAPMFQREILVDCRHVDDASLGEDQATRVALMLAF